MNKSERMTDLILDAYQRCKDNGHKMDWQRYNNIDADAECVTCHDCVGVNHVNKKTMVWGSALTTQCKGR